MTDFLIIGDLSRQLAARRLNSEVRSDLSRSLEETGTGQKVDLSTSLNGDFTQLSALQADLSRIESYQGAVHELLGRGDAIQRALGPVKELVSDTVAQILVASPPQNSGTIRIVAAEARGRFEDFASRLNSSFAGASLFSGVGTDGAAVIAGADMLSILEAIIAPLATAQEVESAIEDWFSAGGGYDSAGYVGELGQSSALQVSETRKIAFGISAQDPSIRQVLSGLAMAALADRLPLSGDLSAQGGMLVSAAENLQGAQDGLSQLQGRIGGIEQELVRQNSRNVAEATALQIERSNLTEVDIFESATKLQAIQSQLELLYSITARNSQLSLVRFLQ